MKSVLVLGASGFIGKHVFEQLNNTYAVLAPSHQELDLENTAAVFEYFKQHTVDVVIHAAHVGSYVDASKDYEIFYKNIRIFENLLRAKNFYRKMIVLGSGAEYDKSRDISGIKEEDFGEYIPTDTYGFQKYIMAQYAEKSDNIIHLRLFGVYGIYEDYKKRFISQTICRLLTNKPVIIKQNVVFDYLYVNDFVHILTAFIERDNWQYNTYNVGSGVSMDLLTIASTIQGLMGTNVPFTVENAGLNKEYTCSISRLTKELPEIEYTDFRDSLKDMILYYSNHLSTIDSTLL